MIQVYDGDGVINEEVTINAVDVVIVQVSLIHGRIHTPIEMWCSDETSAWELMHYLYSFGDRTIATLQLNGTCHDGWISNSARPFTNWLCRNAVISNALLKDPRVVEFEVRYDQPRRR